MMCAEFWEILRSPLLWVVFAAAAFGPLEMSSYYLHVATLALIYVALCSAWNIVGGIGGQISLGHSLFVGTGSLLASALLLKLGINMWVGMLIAAVLSGALGAVIAWIDFRFRLGHLSFALITLAFAEMAEIVAIGWDFVGGASGLLLPRDIGDFFAFQFGGGRGSYWAALTVAAICVLTNLAILNAPLGYWLRCIRDNEDAARAIGVGVLRTKMLAMVISAMLTSIVGTVYARYLAFVDPYQLVSPLITIEIVLFATVGGLGSAFGPALGAIVLLPLGEILRGKLGGVLPGLHAFVYGLIVIATIMLSPRGLLPLFSSWLGGKAAQQSKAPA